MTCPHSTPAAITVDTWHRMPCPCTDYFVSTAILRGLGCTECGDCTDFGGGGPYLDLYFTVGEHGNTNLLCRACIEECQAIAASTTDEPAGTRRPVPPCRGCGAESGTVTGGSLEVGYGFATDHTPGCPEERPA